MLSRGRAAGFGRVVQEVAPEKERFIGPADQAQNRGRHVE
jgi:hypothetical protein